MQKRGFYLFCLLFYSELFSVSGNHYWNQGEAHFEMRTIFLPLETNFFNFFQIFFKVEAAFPYSENIFFNILHPASANAFSGQWKQYFLVSAISLLVETIIGIKKTILRERAHSCQWRTDFPASGKHFFLHFSETSASFFSVQWKSIFQSFLMASTSRKKAVHK